MRETCDINLQVIHCSLVTCLLKDDIWIIICLNLHCTEEKGKQKKSQYQMYGNTKKVKSWVRTLQLKEITCRVRLLFLTLCSQCTLSLPLKTSENLTVFSYFQVVEKVCIENKWVYLYLECNVTSPCIVSSP